MLRRFVVALACAAMLVAGCGSDIEHAQVDAPASSVVSSDGVGPYATAVLATGTAGRVGEYTFAAYVHAADVQHGAAYVSALETARRARHVVRRGGGSCDRAPRYDGNYQSNPNGQFVGRESGGNYGACNESSGACGAYQFTDSTWNGYGGYRSACDAPPAVQDSKAAGMAPCHWHAPNYCA